MPIELHLARAKNELLAEPMTFADPDRCWEDAFTWVKRASSVLVVPEELGPAPDDISVHDRCNRWILYIALSHRLSAQ